VVSAQGTCHQHRRRGRLHRPRRPGSQFRSPKFHRTLTRHGIIGSIGKVASAADNAAMESFFSLFRRTSSRGSRGVRDQLRIRSSPGSSGPTTGTADTAANRTCHQFVQQTRPPGLGPGWRGAARRLLSGHALSVDRHGRRFAVACADRSIGCALRRLVRGDGRTDQAVRIDRTCPNVRARSMILNRL